MTTDAYLNKQTYDSEVILDCMSKTTFALPVPDSRESDFTPGRKVVRFYMTSE